MVGDRFFRHIDSACWDAEKSAAGDGPAMAWICR